MPNDRSRPIVVHMEVAPVSAATAGSKDVRAKSWQAAYEIRYVVPSRDVHAEGVDGDEATMVMGTAVLAFDANGEPMARRFQEPKLRVDEKARAMPDAKVTVQQTVNLPFGRNYLYLAVWDTTTGRRGTVDAEVEVRKAAGR